MFKIIQRLEKNERTPLLTSPATPLSDIFKTENRDTDLRKKKLKLLLISDTHGCYEYHRLDENIFRSVDACICMGDVYETELREIKRCCNEAGIPAYAIPGNHEPMTAVDKEGLTNIHKKVITINDIRIAGWGGCIRYKSRQDLCMMTNEESMQIAQKLPKADILISHSNYKADDKGLVHSGLEGISEYLSSLGVPIHFYGHLHARKYSKLPYNTWHGHSQPGQTKSFCIYRAAVVEINKMITINFLF